MFKKSEGRLFEIRLVNNETIYATFENHSCAPVNYDNHDIYLEKVFEPNEDGWP